MRRPGAHGRPPPPGALPSDGGSRMVMRGGHQWPVAEKCMRSTGSLQRPPHVQPMASKAATTGPPSRIIPGGRRPGRGRTTPARAATTSPLV